MIGKKMLDALNEQVNAELYSAYLYLSMSAYFESVNLRGFASWMRVQAQEEQTHGMKIYGHIIERGGRATMKAIAEPQSEWKSPRAAFEAVLAHERKVTKLIGALVDLAIKEKDHGANNFLQWFVKEQVEEEASAEEVLHKLEQVGESAPALLMLDHQLGERKASS